MKTAPDLPPVTEFASRLLHWFAAACRPLPWRRDYHPYAVWISEIMLQQTQMERGVAYFNAWMRRFPDIRSVAAADEEAILAAWEGLGYYSRARNLQAAAKRIMALHNGEFPSSVPAIRALPGIGDYTAGAIASIAFNIPEPAVDANVLRVFSRLQDIDLPVTDRNVRSRITTAVRVLTPPDQARLFCQALMELGALICGKNPNCRACPVEQFCEANRRGTVAQRPVKTGKTVYRDLETVAGIVMRDNGVFIAKRPPGGLWPGLWEFPNCAVAPGADPGAALSRHLEEIGLRATLGEKLPAVRHGYTTNRITMHCYRCAAAGSPDEIRVSGETAWITPDRIGCYAFPGGQRKILRHLGWK